MEKSNEEQVMTFFKAMVDVERIKIAGLLALSPHTPNEIAEKLKMKLMRVVSHLDLLVYSNLAIHEDQTYRLDHEAIHILARQALSGSRPAVNPEELVGPEYDRKVLSSYLNPDGSVKAFPTQEKKMLAILRYVLPVFQIGVRYPEKTVNEMLKRFHEDTATLRRSLVDFGLLARQEGVYWKVEA